MRTIVFLVALVLTACTTVTPEPVATEAASTLQNWQVKGRMAVIQNNESWPASVHWQQQSDRYNLDLIGPLGQGHISIQGQAGQVTLITDQEQLSAADADSLLSQATGLNIPISGLNYWIRGIPDPGSEARIVRDSAGKITQIEQNDWQIRYPNRIQVQGFDLPKRIQAEQEQQNIQVKIVIGEWTLAD